MEQFFRVGVSLNGVKKRCRKSESHYLHAGYIPYNGGIFNQEEVESLVKSLIDSNMKHVNSKVNVILNHVKVDNGIESWEMFGKTNVKFELKTSLEKALT